MLEFSIVIPTYNRPERLKNCLEAISNLDYPRDRVEVIVVDDGSPTPLAPIVENFKTQLSLHFIQQENTGPATARNMGASVAKGDYLVFTDDDCQPDPQWLQSLAAAIAAFPKALIGGYTLNALPDNLYSSASQLLIDYLYNYYNQTQGKAKFFASNNFALPRLLYEKIGGFNTSFPLPAGEDRELCDRWQNEGFMMQYAPEMKVNHAHFLTFKSFWRQHFNYGRGAFYFHQLRSKRNAEPMQVEPLKFYLELVTFPFRKKRSGRTLSLSGLLFLSQVANVAGFSWEKWQSSSSKQLN